MLGGDVRGHAREPDEPGTGRGVHDRAPAGLEDLGDLEAHAEEHAGEHDVDAAVPLVEGIVGDRLPGAGDPRVVVREVEAAVRVDRGRHHVLDRGWISHVSVRKDCVTAVGLDQLGGLLAARDVDVGDDNLRAPRREQTSGRAADARRRTRDDRDLPGEVGTGRVGCRAIVHERAASRFAACRPAR